MKRFFGYDVVKAKHNHQFYESHLIQLLQRYRINCVLDVGANRGQYGSLLRSLGYRGKIISFEPVQASFDALARRSSQDRLWDVYPYALGSENGRRTIRVIKNSDLSSFREPNEQMDKMFAADQGGKVESWQEVLVQRLDTVFLDVTKKAEASGRLALKMDTQGYDLEVFQGAEQVLEKISVLQSEISAIALYKDTPNFVSALEVYLQKGFEITGLFPECRNMQDFRVIEFNCLMARAELLPRM